MDIELFTVKEVATILKTNTNYVYELINSGKLTAIKMKSLKVTKKSIQKFLDDYDGKNLSDLNNVTNLVQIRKTY